MTAALLNAALPAPPAGRVLVGYSGGLDSRVLLQLAWRRYGAALVSAIHVHHGLSPNADHWARHCAASCAELGVACQIERVNAAAGAGGPEARARSARYAAFTKWLREGDLLLLAHHADDQAETLLYRLLRSGVASGMPTLRPLGRGHLVRPLLDFPRSALRAYAEREQLSWIEDESNATLHADRNYLRHRVLPALAGRWPDAVMRLGRAAALSASAAHLHRELAMRDLAELDERAERVGRSLDLRRLLALPAHRRDNLLRHWLPTPGGIEPAGIEPGGIESGGIESGGIEPGARVLASLDTDLAAAADDAQPLISWAGGQWRRFRDRLYLLPPDWGAAPAGERGPWCWSSPQPLRLPDGAMLGARMVIGSGFRPGGELIVRYRRGGERVRPQGRKGSNSLKKILQEQGLEPWLRECVPLIERDGQLVAVGDLFICAQAVVDAGEPGCLPVWRCPAR